jgi:hypothetical protein
VFPVIPLLALAGLLGSGYTLYWYSRLEKDQQEEADRVAGRYALALFGKQLDQLTAEQARRVHALTQGHFRN